jgi:parallel beta-helix repeat protein
MMMIGIGMGRMMGMSRGVLRLAVPVMMVTASCAPSALHGGPIVLEPGQDLQAIVASSPEGTQFLLAPGIYRQQTIHPKPRQEFIGQDGAILSGAMELKSWKKEGKFWIAEGLPPALPVGNAGRCDDDGDRCRPREDLFFDGRLYLRAESLASLVPGTWHRADGKAWLADDPTGASVELSVTPLAIGGSAQGVIVRNLIIEKYAPAAQRAAIEFYDGRGWLVSNVTARWNHTIGLTFGPEARVEGGSFSHNGQVGMKGTGEGSIVDEVEIAFNNYAGYDPGWEAGGTKFYRSRGLVVRNSCIHHNYGHGLWTDIDNVDVLYEGNKVFMNRDDGIKHEISYDATIRNNTVAYNGHGFDVWLWGSQILLQNSEKARVYRNTVVVSDGGNGISVIHQDRGVGKYGPWNATDNYIHHNTVVHLGKYGVNGVVMDTDDDWFWSHGGNRFDWNTYIVADDGTKYWTFDWAETWNDVKKLGQEQNGERILEQRPRIDLSCD